MPKTDIKSVTCKIIDAEYKDFIGDEEKPIYKNIIVLTLQDLQSKHIFKAFLTSKDISEIAHTKKILSSKEMILFAKYLSERTDPVKLNVPIQGDRISPEILASSDTDYVSDFDAVEDYKDEELVEEILENSVIEEIKTIQNKKKRYKQI